MPYAALKIIGGSGWRYLGNESAGRCRHDCTLALAWLGMGIQENHGETHGYCCLLYLRHVFSPFYFNVL